MIKGIDNLNTWIKTNRLERWSVKNSPDKDQFLFTCDFEEPESEKKSRFDTVISTLSPGRYYIEGQATKSTRGTFRESFMILPGDTVAPDDAPMAASGLQPAIAGSPEDFRERLNTAVELERVKMELDRKNELIAERDEYIKELEKELEKSPGDSPLDKVLNTLNPYIPAIAQRFFGGESPKVSPGIAGVPEQPAGEQEDQIGRLLDRVSELFDTPDPVAFLERLLAVLEANPTYIPMIKALTKDE